MPQAARLAAFAADPGPAVLIATPERVRLYQDLAVLGQQVSLNPGVAEWPERHAHVVLDVECALADFPADPDAYRLELRVGDEYPREELLDRLYDLGYEREENLEPRALAKVDAYVSVRGDTVEVTINAAAGKKVLRAEFFGDELESLRLDDEKVRHYGLGPLGDFIQPSPWSSSRLEQLPGRVYLDAPEFFEGHLEFKRNERLWAELREREVVSFGRSPLEFEPHPPLIEALPYYRARLRAFGDDARGWAADGYRIVALLKHERTAAYLQSHVLGDLTAVWEWRAEAAPGQVTFVKAAGEGGFIDRAAKVVVVTEDLLYGFQGGSALRSKRLKGPPVSDTMALSVGDYLIHPEHGIGQFQGLEARPVLGVTRDYLVLKYANDARIFLPVEQLPSLRRHPGTTDDPPRLSTLGTNEWTRAREKARANAEELAKKLLVQYAARQATPGAAYPPLPDDWEDLIKKNFPFELTPDQDAAIRAVMHDLERPHPMDRLVSGDVGFGKTEVAVRAAHRIVGHGRQVALLVPTTLLADQHLETFRKRFTDLPVRVAGLSRFTTGKEADAVYKGLRNGTIDIVIGTHRLLSQDLEFKNLGLLIIDEEHRFGVMQKEKLKALKSVGSLSPDALEKLVANKPKRGRRRKDDDEPPQPEVAASLAEVAGKVIGEKPKPKVEVPVIPENAIDVLSLSATPIPRTLYMSMVGLRDISHIATPPAGRKPIRTVLSPFDPATVRDAVMSEMERGGKAFFIHDRVASIAQRARYLGSLLPEARIAVAHGQMRDDDIEEIMLGFEEGAYDLLVSTTIVESGLDIPEANTILIERSDRLGLAQLYQLRGRVGRRATEAYAFLFYPPRLSEGAERRLWAIADLADLGSGHLLAEKDMEIRGVGNILGPEQHGHIQMVSLEVYTELLAEAIARLKGDGRVERPRMVIDLAVDARLDHKYLPDETERITYYGRLSEAAGLADITRVERELKARHGPLPREVQNFIDLARLRVVAASKGVLSIAEAMTHIQVTFANPHLDYDAKALRSNPHRPEVTKYPPGFRLEKRGMKPDEYARAVLNLLYSFA
ncbi:MAG TPA: DEAD/DEAH box helicase [Deinococcales bacterium]|nr:DEAD/DEAH box helicase [Deinococcales bacterium]